MIHPYTRNDFKFFNMSGFIAARALDYVENFIKPGITTDFIDNEVYNFLKKKMRIQHLYFIEDSLSQYVPQSMKLFVMVYHQKK